VGKYEKLIVVPYIEKHIVQYYVQERIERHVEAYTSNRRIIKCTLLYG
jgi:hypothetical protein